MVLAAQRTVVGVVAGWRKDLAASYYAGEVDTDAVDSDAGNGSLWLGGREGVSTARTMGRLDGDEDLPVSDISGMSWDPQLKRVIVTSWNSSWVLAVNPADRTFKFWDPGWKVRHVHSAGGRLLAATSYNGVVVEPATRSSASLAINP